MYTLFKLAFLIEQRYALIVFPQVLLSNAQHLLLILGVGQRKGITPQASGYVIAQPAPIRVNIEVVLTIQAQQRHGLVTLISALALLDEAQRIMRQQLAQFGQQDRSDRLFGGKTITLARLVMAIGVLCARYRDPFRHDVSYRQFWNSRISIDCTSASPPEEPPDYRTPTPHSGARYAGVR